jgi:cyclopropane-fatty-acyl-phospholipid synthase
MMWQYKLLEMNIIPEWLIRLNIRGMLNETIQKNQKPTLAEQQQQKMSFIDELKTLPIAIETNAANDQHYEVPSEFYQWVLGPRRKYSSGLWLQETDTLADAERQMLSVYCSRADIQDGQKILDLGCGWGSLALYLAEHYPNAHITALSNSNSQREYIEWVAQTKGWKNLTVVTANIATYDTDWTFDRILSIEMLEHMKNYELLFEKVSRWITPAGLFFVHIFTHEQFTYHYQDTDGTDWLTRHFFTGGTMPSADLFHYFQKDLKLVNQWSVDGTHYEKTANAWLENMHTNKARILPILKEVYGSKEQTKWWVRWKVFMMACAELWGYKNGKEWSVTHYLFSPQQARVSHAMSAQAYQSASL